jgi:diguanylate cyclase (GGDEF)-like protein
MAVRLLLGWHWQSVQADPSQWRKALNWRMLISATYGLGWGGSMLVLNTGSLDVLTTFKVATLTAALGVMLNSMSVVFTVYMAFLLPCWLSLMYYIFFASGFLTPQDAIICGVAVSIFGVVLIGSSVSIARLTRMFFHSKFELDEALLKTQESHQREMQMSQKLAEQARRDALTGAYNRRHMSEQLEYQLNTYLRSHRPFSVVMIDIDHFKAINDQYGHDVGDAVLKEATFAMSRGMREIDICGRWGGEAENAMTCAERLRVIFKSSRFDEVAPDLVVTASFGVATSCPDDKIEDMVKRCDMALYRSKSDGRDRVSFALKGAD